MTLIIGFIDFVFVFERERALFFLLLIFFFFPLFFGFPFFPFSFY